MTMNQLERVSKIPVIWRHGVQIAAACIGVVVGGLDIGGNIFPGFGQNLLKIFDDVAMAFANNQETFLKWISWGVGGLAAVIGAYFTALKNKNM